MASSLAEFAATRKKRKCFTCRLPADVLAQVEAERAKAPQVSYPIISEWLVQEGHKISSYNLRSHFQKRHHEDER